MRTIWKYQLPVEDSIYLELPIGAQIISVQGQHNVPQLWAIVDSKAEHETRHFVIVGTGQNMTQDWLGIANYIGTFQLFDGEFVGHLFEVVG